MNSNNNQLFSYIENIITKHKQSKQKIWVGFSGGTDSTALLHILTSMKNIDGITAIHINHQLNKKSDLWQKHCEDFCASLQVPLICKTVTITKPYKQGLEAEARFARYKAFSEIINQDDLLLLAHHKLDQLETFLYRLIKGHGISGLAGIPEYRKHNDFYLLRPLLNINKSIINNYITQQDLNYIDDPSNADNKFERNWLRNILLPIIAKRHEKILDSIYNSQLHLIEAKELLEDLAFVDFKKVCSKRHNRIIISELNKLSISRKINCIRVWLQKKNVVLPNRKQLKELMTQLMNIKQGKHPECCWQQYCVKAYNNELYLIINTSINKLNSSFKINFDENLECHLINNGYLKAYKKEFYGLGSLKDLYYKPPVNLSLSVSLINRQGSKKLKTLLHEFNIPPWKRDVYPLLFSNNQLVYLPNIGVIDNVKDMQTKCFWHIQWHAY